MIHGECGTAVVRRRGPGRSYSGALYLDVLSHARFTECGPTADGVGTGEGRGGRSPFYPKRAMAAINHPLQWSAWGGRLCDAR